MGIDLKQTKSGKWKACGSALKYHSVVIEEDTPDRALESARRFLDAFELFVDHLHGLCDQTTCETCQSDADGVRSTRGIKTGKRPKRYAGGA